MAGFIIWSAVALLLLGLALKTWCSKKTASFYTGVKAPEVRDVRKYNHAVALLWAFYAAAFELLGIPILFLAKNKALIAVILLGVPLLSIGLVIAYQAILHRMEKHK